MNIKILTKTLSQCPNLQMLEQLENLLCKQKVLLVSDIQNFFSMISKLLNCGNINVYSKALLFLIRIIEIILPTEVQMCWAETSRSVINLLGESDKKIRKLTKNAIFCILSRCNNILIILNKVHEYGILNQKSMVVMSSLKLVFIILEQNSQILKVKSSIFKIKLIFEKIIQLANNNQCINLKNKARQFLNKLFYLQIQNLDEVLHRMNPYYRNLLEQFWKKQKDQIFFKQSNINIKYQHLPLIGNKIFGVYQPFILKQIFNPDNLTTKKFSISQLKEIYFENTVQLNKYLKVLVKIIIKFLPEQYIDLLKLLNEIMIQKVVTNIINLAQLAQLLVKQLENQQILYRKELRTILHQMNFLARNQLITIYQNHLRQEIFSNQNWIKNYQILLLIQHWFTTADPEECYPPILNEIVVFLWKMSHSSIIKVKTKSHQILLLIIDQYQAYKQNIQEVASNYQIGELEDQLQQQYQKKHTQKEVEAQQTFIKDYFQERQRYLKQKNK